MKTATEFFKLANNKTVIKKISGVPTVEDKEKIISNIKAQLLEQGAKEEDIEVTEDKISIGRQFWMLPKMKAEEKGILVVRSKDYVFQSSRGPVYGDKVGCKVVNGVCTKQYENGMIVTFELVDTE